MEIVFLTGNFFSLISIVIPQITLPSVKITTMVAMLVNVALVTKPSKLKMELHLLNLSMLPLVTPLHSLRTSTCTTTPEVFYLLSGPINTVAVETQKFLVKLFCNMLVKTL